MRSTSVPTHLSAADSTFMAHRPMARTAFLTKSTSTSVEYLAAESAAERGKGSLEEGREIKDSEREGWRKREEKGERESK